MLKIIIWQQRNNPRQKQWQKLTLTTLDMDISTTSVSDSNDVDNDNPPNDDQIMQFEHSDTEYIASGHILKSLVYCRAYCRWWLRWTTQLLKCYI